MTDDLSNHDNNSIWSKVPPSPRAANEDLIWKSRVSQKNQLVRGQNSAVGRLGQYIVLDPENRVRLDEKLKKVLKDARVTPGPRNSGGGLNKTVDSIATLEEMLKPPNAVRKPPTRLEPLGDEALLRDFTNKDITIGNPYISGSVTAKVPHHARRGSHMMPDLDAIAGGRVSRNGASTNRSHASHQST